ncbi:hypothetical protein [Cellulomonas hominis]|uniref:hypothetical protein n=1 Tax=Cellulomonas hominis TaxID=156981 RepID=UPI001BA3D477|nr:hypothetical protein [Cellulomonas hominis]VTR78593.1 hypothetical protein CHMI_03376 [Cellulomonas hominis]
MSVRQRVMSVLTLTGCLVGLVAIPAGWGAHEPARFCQTAAECPDLRWPAASTVPLGTVGLDPVTATPAAP